MPDYLLDTNHASRLLADDPQIAARLHTLARQATRFMVCVPVVGELYYAVYASQRQAENLRALQAFLTDTPILPFDLLAAEAFGRIQAEQKAKGRPIPSTDAQIAAIARTHQLTLLTADRHFQHITNLTLENWLTD